MYFVYRDISVHGSADDEEPNEGTGESEEGSEDLEEDSDLSDQDSEVSDEALRSLQT